jgi:ferredoxin
MADGTAPQKIRIVFFSGTGGTRLAAEKLAAHLTERSAAVCLQELGIGVQPDTDIKEDLLVVMYPVYAMRAPVPVYGYIKNHEPVRGLQAAVISVSGGGEMTPNKACRRRAIKLLEKKGYRVVYERMLLMPANVLTATPPAAAVCLVRALPEKTKKIAEDLLGGVTRRTKPGLLNRMISAVGVLETAGAHWFGRHIRAGKSCSGCGICAAHCPSGNIRLEGDRPVFGMKCWFCMRCLYACPEKALSPRYAKFFMIKEGFSLRDIERAAADENTPGCAEKMNGALWGGVREYLAEKD